MRRTIGFALVCAGFASVLSGCQAMPDPAFAALERSMSLRIVEVRRSERGDSAEFTLELKNGGRAAANACLGPGRNVDYWFGSSGGSVMNWTHHPGCVREFSVPTGGSMVWNETAGVILPQGGEVRVTVQILNPRRCSSVGCAAFDLRSQTFQVP
jgi:hypothetical protein